MVKLSQLIISKDYDRWGKYMKLSVLIPFYNEEEQAALTLATVDQILSTQVDCDYEIIVVDDGSRDKTWSIIETEKAKYPKLRALRFSRNFGKEAAVCALLEHAEGDCAVLMDGDLQHPPRYIPEMLRLWREEGWHIVDGVKIERQKESLLGRVSARLFYKVFKKLSHLDLQNASDFKLLDRKAIDAFNACPERNTFFRGLSAWIGFKRTPLLFEVDDRTAGVSKWSPKQLFRLSAQAITSFSSAPLNLVSYLGIVFWVFAIILGIQTLVNFILGRAAGGFTTVILLLLIVGGSIMLALGLIGSYIGRIYMEIKARPRYLLCDEIKITDTISHSPVTNKEDLSPMTDVVVPNKDTQA